MNTISSPQACWCPSDPKTKQLDALDFEGSQCAEEMTHAASLAAGLVPRAGLLEAAFDFFR